jgi:hypothetical protein
VKSPAETKETAHLTVNGIADRHMKELNRLQISVGEKPEMRSAEKQRNTSREVGSIRMNGFSTADRLNLVRPPSCLLAKATSDQKNHQYLHQHISFESETDLSGTDLVHRHLRDLLTARAVHGGGTMETESGCGQPMVLGLALHGEPEVMTLQAHLCIQKVHHSAHCSQHSL